MKQKKPELLSPAGDWISLRAAVDAGSDAVYFGIDRLNMRQNTDNFSVSKLGKVINYCHEHSVQAYLALNVIVYQSEISYVKKILVLSKKLGIDAVIAWDLAVLKICADLGIKIHLSTQASVSNFESASYYHHQFHVRRVVLARECTLSDIKHLIKKIKSEKIGLEVEAFIHGAMCVSVSGRCFMSQFMFNKSANRGECLQPCRRSYILTDPEEGHQLELHNNFVMSPRDLCTMPFIEKLIESGMDSFKIEGRNRSPEYVRVVTSAYREIIDFYFKYRTNPGLAADFNRLKSELTEKMRKVYNRGFSSGFYLGRPIAEWTDAYGSKATQKKVYVGKVVNYYPKAGVAEIRIESGHIQLGDEVMFQGQTTGVISQKIGSMQLEDQPINLAEKGKRITMLVADKLRRNDKLYRIIDIAH